MRCASYAVLAMVDEPSLEMEAALRLMAPKLLGTLEA
jgi:hypothetical protein